MAVDKWSLIILSYCISGVMALDEGLSGLIVAGVVAGVLLIVGVISISIWCFIKSRDDDEDKHSLDIVSSKITPRYTRFPPTMKFRSYGPTSPRSRPPVTFFTVRDSPRGAPVLPLTGGAPYLFQPRGPVMYVEENGDISARSSVKDRDGHYRRSTKAANGHAGSMKIKEVHSNDDVINFESSEDENGNKKRTIDNRSRSKSRDRKYIKNPDHKSNHRQRQSHNERSSRSNSRSRNRSQESRNSVNSNTIIAQPGDIILNPISFDTQSGPTAHQSPRTESPFIPVITRNSPFQVVPSTSTAFHPYARDEEPDLETPREDYLTPRSTSEMPSTIAPESSRSDFITPSADYPRTKEFTYPPRPSSNDPFISPRPPTPEFDADSILYAAQTQVTVVRNKSPVREVFESTPRSDTPPVAPPPPPPPPVVSGSTESGNYLSAVNRAPTPPPGKLLPVSNIDDILNGPSTSSGSFSKRPSGVGVSPQHNALMEEMKNRRQRVPSHDDIGLPPSSGKSSPARFSSRGTDSPSVPADIPRRQSEVHFTESPPEIIPRDVVPESPDLIIPDYEPGSVSSVFDSVMKSGVPSHSNIPVAPPPPPLPPI